MTKKIMKILIFFNIIISFSFFSGSNIILAKENYNNNDINQRLILIKIIDIIDNDVLKNKNFTNLKKTDTDYRGKIAFLNYVLSLKKQIKDKINLIDKKRTQEKNKKKIHKAKKNSKNIKLINNQKKYWPSKKIHKPGYLKSIFDPIFKTKITRITGDPNKRIPNLKNQRWPKKQLRHGYSKRQPWNSNESMIYLDRMKPKVWLDGKTYKVLFTRHMPGTRVRWSMTEPNYMYYINNNNNTFGKWNVVRDKKNKILDLKKYKDITFGEGEGNFTWNGKKVAILATRRKDKHQVIFIVDVKTGKKTKDIDMHKIAKKVNNCTISPLGNYIVASINTKKKSDILLIMNAKTGKIILKETERGIPSHFDVQIDQDGDEVVAGVSKTTTIRNGIYVKAGMVIKRKLSNGKLSVVSNKRYASHTSGRGVHEPGWIYVTYQNRDSKYSPYINEVVKMKLDGTETKRIANLHSKKFNYYSESHAVPSPSGTRVMWASDWDTKKYPIQAYVADYRKNIK